MEENGMKIHCCHVPAFDESQPPLRNTTEDARGTKGVCTCTLPRCGWVTVLVCRPVTALRGIVLITLPAEGGDGQHMFSALPRSFPVYVGRTMMPHPRCKLVDQQGHPHHPNFFAIYNLWCFDQPAPVPHGYGMGDRSITDLKRLKRSIDKKKRGLHGYFVRCVSQLQRRLCVLADRDSEYRGEHGLMELVNPTT